MRTYDFLSDEELQARIDIALDMINIIDSQPSPLSKSHMDARAHEVDKLTEMSAEKKARLTDDR